MNEQTTPQPPDKRRIVKAFFLAPLIIISSLMCVLLLATGGDLAGGNVPWTIFIWVAALLIAYAHILLLALPLYLAIRNRIGASMKLCTVLGFLIGCIPLLILYIFYGQLDSASPPPLAASSLIFGLIGAAIGYAFWRIGIKPVDSK